MKLITLIITFVFLAGCQSVYEKDEDSAYYLVPVGSKLILHQELTIPAGKAGVYIQDGKVIPKSNYRQYYPHCRFELLTVKQTEQSVKPDEFIIHKVNRDRSVGQTGAIQLAGFYPTRGMRFRGDMPSDELFSTILYLRSVRQPNVYLIYCGEWGTWGNVTIMTISHIRKQLDNIFSLELNE